MKYLSLLFLLPLLSGCGTSDSAPTPEFSVRDSLRTSTITIEVPGFNEAMDPIAAIAYWYTWHSQDQESRQLFFDAAGRTSFEVSENIIRSYNLIYGENFFEFVARPGEDLTLQFVHDTINGGYQLRAPNAPFTDQAADIYAALAPPDWFALDSLVKEITGLDAKLAFYEDIARQRRQRLAALWSTGKYADPLLRDYANNYIDNRIYADFSQDVLSVGMSSNADSLKQQYLRNNNLNPLPEPIISSSNLIGNLHNEQMVVTRLAYNATKHLPLPERKAAYYAESVRLIDSLYAGFIHDFMLTRIYDLQLLAANPAPTLVADAEYFAYTTPYPSFSGPLREKLSILAGETVPVNRYQQQLEQLPAGLDNPVPDLLRAHAGKVIILDFWATWCSPCTAEMKNDYPAFMKKYDPEQVAVVFLARRSPENIWRDQISKLEYPAIHLLTNEEQTTVLNKLFGISGIPHHAVFDQAGTLVQAKVDGPGHGLEAVVDRLLGR